MNVYKNNFDFKSYATYITYFDTSPHLNLIHAPPLAKGACICLCHSCVITYYLTIV